jgi:outer membrane protein assembly factor BamA
MDTLAKKDSVTVIFNLGQRIIFGNLYYIDSTRGQHIVTHEMKRRQFEIKTGDWYSRSKVNTTIENLLSLDF